MSLKTFHIFFIIVSLLTTLGFGILCFKTYVANSSPTYLAMGLASLLAGVALIVYGFWFLGELKKLK